MKIFDFTHLHKAESSYIRHLIVALWFTLIAVGVVITGLIHAIFPFMFGFLPYRLAKRITDGTENNFKSTED